MPGGMPGWNKLVLVAVAVVASVATASARGAASATGVAATGATALQYGVSDDWPKYHPCGDAWWNAAQDIGYTDLRITVKWAGATTLTAGLKNAVDCAALKGTQLVISVYPAKPDLIGSSDSAQTAFASF